MNNIVEAVFGTCNPYECATRILYRYDYGMILTFPGIDLPTAYEVHFSNYDDVGTTITQIGNEDGVSIPDEFLQTGLPVYCWVYLHTGEDDGETVYKVTINVQDRPQPSNGTPTPVQQDAITEAIAALDSAVEQTGADASSANADALKSEGYAVGTQDGEPVEQGSPYYRHNSLWLSQQAGQSANKAEAQASLSEAWAVGEISGHPVPSDYPQYQNNSKYYAEQASKSAKDAEESAQSVLGLTADATVDSNVGTPSVSVSITTESDHKKMSFAFHNLKGVQGDTGVGISSVVLNADYTLTITLTSGTSYTTSSIRGEVGATPNLTIGTVSTLPEGSQATATITGTDEDPVLNLGIPVGDTGDPGISPTITVTEITGGHEVAVTDAQGTQTFDVMDGEVSEQDLEDALIDKADIITSSASGEIVTIADGAKNLPVVDLKVSLLPVQNLNGQSNPYPPGGGTNIWGGIKLANDINNAVQATLDTTAKTITFSTNAQPSGTYDYNSIFTPDVTFEENTVYTLITSGTSANLMNLMFKYTDGSNDRSLGRNPNIGAFASAPGKTVENVVYRSYSGNTVLNYENCGLFKGNVSASAFAPYSNVCPISGWTGVDIHRYHLPAGYTPVEYVQVSQAIEITGILPSFARSDLSIACTFKPITYVQYGAIYRTYVNESTNATRIIFNNSISSLLVNNNTKASSSYGFTINSNQFNRVVSGDHFIVVNGTTQTYVAASGSENTNTTFTIGGNNHTIQYKELAIKKTNEDEIYMSLIPCKNPSGIAGFYDIVGKKFYTTADPTKISASGDPQKFAFYGEDFYSFDWTDDAGTVYVGSLNIITGELTVSYVLNTITSFQGAWGSTTNGYAVYVDATGADRNGVANRMLSNYFKFDRLQYANMPLYSYCGDSGVASTYTFILPSTVTSLEEANAWLANLDTPVQYIAHLINPVVYQLSENQIETLLGTNVFWCSNNSLDLEYRCDTKLYIENLTKPSEDDMVANANIASGKFFMVGNRLMLSTTAIAQGEQIVVGTNCSEVSLADALNQINA